MDKINCYFDFETDNAIPTIAKPIEVAFIFDGFKTIHSKIKIDYRIEDSKYNQISALNYNEIKSNDDIRKHNSDNAISINQLKEMLKECADLDKIEFIGWNNTSFDNIIFDRLFSNIFHKPIVFSDCKKLFLELKKKNCFLYENKLNLESVYMHFIDGDISEEFFHKALNDAKAIKKVWEFLNQFGRVHV